jgi:uncharacterized phage-associated protein
MATIKQVSDYIILQLGSDGGSDLTSLKLQKLLYYTQAWHLAFYKKPLFEGKFQAWVHGPVNREIYDLYKATKYTYSEISLSDVQDKEVESKLSQDEILHIKTILDVYAKFSPTQLEFMTHNEDPWIKARQGVPTYQKSENIINEEIMAFYYKSRIKNNN